MKGLYLCSREHRIPGYEIIYNDIVNYPGIDLCMDIRDIRLKDLVNNNIDYIIATPPCNFYSRANYRRESSIVAQETKDLLPYCLALCIKSGLPFIIENVMNSTLLPKSNLYEFDFGQYHFYTNVFMLVPDKSYAVSQNKQNVTRSKRDGNKNVDLIIKLFLELVHEKET